VARGRVPSHEPDTRPKAIDLPQVAQDGFEGFDDFVLRRAPLTEAQFQVERLGRRPVGEDEMLRPARLRLGDGLAELLARRAALGGDLIDQGHHFIGVFLPNYLQKHGLR
jgi:hypothetical protein